MASNPANPWAAAFSWQRQGLEAMTEAVEASQAAPDSLATMQEVEVGQTPSDVVYEENKLELLHYDAEAAGIDVPEEEKESIPILIVYALINRPYILDLQPERSVVRRLLEAGHDVYLIKWNEPSRLDQHLTLDDYVNRYIENCVDVVRDRSGQDAINLLGYCMGGTMSAIYAALHPEKVNALGLMAAGLCFEDSGGILEEWGAGEYYEPEAITDAFGNVPSEFLDVGFALMDPVDNYVSKYIRLAENIENESFVENFGRMEQWLSEGVDVAGDTYVEFLEKIYQNNDLYNNRLEIGGKHVDLANIDMPVLQLMGEYDHLVPASASKPFNDVIASDDVETIEYSTGHIGLSVSSSSHEDVWPRASDWFKERSAEHGEADERASGEAASSAAAGAETTDEQSSSEGRQSSDAAVDIEIESPEEAAAEAVKSVEEEADGEADQGDESMPGQDRTPGEIEQRGEEDPEEVPAEPGEMEVDEEIVEDIVDEEAAADATEEDGTDAADGPGAAGDPSEEDDESVSVGEGEADVAGEAAAEAEGESPDVETVAGVGATYAQRLRDAGVETVADLKEYSAAELADIAQTSEARAQDWLDQA